MTKQLSSQAAAAKAIRAELKAAYPTVTFKVHSSSFSMGNSVDIGWTDGPTAAEVDALTNHYQYGHFDGSIDLYEYSNRRDDIPQAKYVSTNRHISRESMRAIVDRLNAYCGYSLRIIDNPTHVEPYIDRDSDTYIGNGYASFEVMRMFQGYSLLCRHCSATTLPGDAYCPQCGHALSDEEAAA